MKRDTVALYLVARDKRTPLVVKLLAGAVAAYALSPIDLIPDVIPILGYLDDLLLVPLGIALVLRLIPPALLAEHRHAAETLAQRPTSRAAAIGIILAWLLAAIACGAWLAARIAA